MSTSQDAFYLARFLIQLSLHYTYLLQKLFTFDPLNTMFQRVRLQEIQDICPALFIHFPNVMLRLPDGWRDYFSYHERAIPQIYFCRLQVRLGQIMVIRHFAVRLGWNKAIKTLNPRLGQVRLAQPRKFFYKANLT